MENASKALLIAGAILIAILLIAIGMKVFNSASGVVNSAGSNMSSQEKTMFNKQWDQYSGKQSGSVLKQLVTDVNANNAGDNEKITFTVDTKEPTADDFKIVGPANYNVDITDTDGNGLYDTIAATIDSTTGGES